MWVEGDNPPHSHDSRYFGPVPMALVTTKLEFVVRGGAVRPTCNMRACTGVATEFVWDGQTFWSTNQQPNINSLLLVTHPTVAFAQQ